MLFSAAFGQGKTDGAVYQDEYLLKPNERIERKITKGEKHIYTVNLKRGELLHIRVEQHGIDLAAAIAKKDSERKLILQTDRAEAADGTESFAFVAETDGEYIFGVFGFEAASKDSGYVLQNTAPLESIEEKQFAVADLEKLGAAAYDEKNTQRRFSITKTRLNYDKRRFNVVHFATHFRLGSDTADSFLLLGNNKALTLAEVADSPEMNLTDVELVTLSACNTGFGGLANSRTLTENNGAEVDSLAQFIELRGAKSVLATLWSVADESTAILMGEFYRLRKENQNWTKAETLRQAQLELLNGKYTPEQIAERNRSEAVRFGAGAKNMPKFAKDENAPFAHPFYWSPFVLIGNWR